MPDLSDLLKDAVGEIPAFDAGALVAKERHRRQLQAAGAASTAAAVALFVGVAFNHGSGGRVAIKTTSDVSDAPPTTHPPTTGFSLVDHLDRQHDDFRAGGHDRRRYDDHRPRPAGPKPKTSPAR